MHTTELVTTEDQLHKWVKKVSKANYATYDTETTSTNPMTARLVGLVFAVKEPPHRSSTERPVEACYIPVGHETKKQLPINVVRDATRNLLSKAPVTWIAHNSIYDNVVLHRHGWAYPELPEDTMLMSYALDGKRHGHGFDELCDLHFDHRSIKFDEVVVQNNWLHMDHFGHVKTSHACSYAAEDGAYTLKLFYRLRRLLKEEGMWDVYRFIDQPLIPALVDMKLNGLKISREALDKLTKKLTKKMNAAEDAVLAIDPNVDIMSPKQVGELLYDKLGLEPTMLTKKNKAPSTKTKAIEMLVDEHPVVQKIIDFKEYQGLVNKYTGKLPTFVNEDTGRIHCSLNPTVTNTGRFSASDPPLQQIPIRTEMGKEIRHAFIAERGNKIISADYSQIELRILAHVAEEAAMIDAFRKKIDQHTATAEDIFVLKAKDFTEDEWGTYRGKGKTLNFAIVYGITKFGLAIQLKAPEDEAEELIERYFMVRPGIKDAMDRSVEFLKQHGYTETIYGRRVYQELTGNGWQDAHAERAAFNAEIQGSAADLIRLAIPAVRSELKGCGLKKTKMLLQVHDELLFEAPEEEADEALPIIKSAMETAGGKWIKWRVPIVCEAKAGASWGAAH